MSSGKSNIGLRLGERCPFYEVELDDAGLVMQVFCENPKVVAQVHAGEMPVCPYTWEYECDVPIHLKNIGIGRGRGKSSNASNI